MPRLCLHIWKRGNTRAVPDKWEETLNQKKNKGDEDSFQTIRCSLTILWCQIETACNGVKNTAAFKSPGSGVMRTSWPWNPIQVQLHAPMLPRPKHESIIKGSDVTSDPRHLKIKVHVTIFSASRKWNLRVLLQPDGPCSLPGRRHSR